MHYYKRHLGDYSKKAGHLSPLEHGIYNLIIDGYYDREQAPTLIEATRWARARTEEEKAAVLAVLDEFFTLDGERYVQSRIEEELATYHGKAEKNREIAEERERRKRERRDAKVSATERAQDVDESSTTGARNVHEACTTGSPEQHESSTSGQPNHKPLTTNHKPLKEEKSNARASRLPASWGPSDEDVAYCRAQRPDLDPARVAENFRDYWHAKAGKDACKLDWSATWRTWVRNEKSSPVARAPAGSVSGDKFRVAGLDHSSSRAAMEASMKRHGIVVPEDDDEIAFN